MHALSVSIYQHSLVGIYLDYGKTTLVSDQKLVTTSLLTCCSFPSKGLFDTRKEGFYDPNYNEKGFFEKFKLFVMWNF